MCVKGSSPANCICKKSCGHSFCLFRCIDEQQYPTILSLRRFSISEHGATRTLLEPGKMRPHMRSRVDRVNPHNESTCDVGGMNPTMPLNADNRLYEQGSQNVKNAHGLSFAESTAHDTSDVLHDFASWWSGTARIHLDSQAIKQLT